VVRGGDADGTITFHLTAPERDLLLEMLHSYPLVSAAHHRVSKGIQDDRAAEWQQLLEQAVAEQRSSNKRQIAVWLAEPSRFQKVGKTWQLSVKAEHTEWLLQVLNDIRVGCWVLLGSPEQPLDPAQLDSQRVRVWVTMEVSGWFQMALLTAGRAGG
jgi:hypothetical protein